MAPFEHLTVPLVTTGPARLFGGGEPSPVTKENRENRGTHADTLTDQLTGVLREQIERRQQRTAAAPTIPAGIPILLKIDPELELDKLRATLGFEIVSEEDDGFVIVASQDLELREILEKIQGFTQSTHGTGAVASLHSIESENERLRRVLSPLIYENWAQLQDPSNYIVDVSIECLGRSGVPYLPNRKAGETDDQWENRRRRYHERFLQAQAEWDEIKDTREAWLTQFVTGYRGQILRVTQDDTSACFELPDSFSSRISISGQGLRDLALNTPFIFELSEPDELNVLAVSGFVGAAQVMGVTLVPPAETDPSVCVIDSGIQEGHPYLAAAIDTASSRSFVNEAAPTDVADYVPGGGHGTRVAGAVLYPSGIPRQGNHNLACWIQNVRILDDTNNIPQRLFPPKLLEYIVSVYGDGGTKIFNHSVASRHACRTRHMSTWATAIDRISATQDVLFLQATGNLLAQTANGTGFQDHLAAGTPYPGYLLTDGSRVANPGQALHALTVGSVGLTAWTDGVRNSFVRETNGPSAFSRTGLGIWDSIKPDVVEVGGDYVHDSGNPPVVSVVADTCPELTRSTLGATGPLFDRDAVGSSFSCPKVAAVAAAIQKILPNSPALLYRALIAQSARWPEWARNHTPEQGLEYLRLFGFGLPDMKKATGGSAHRVTLVTDVDHHIKARDAHIFQIPIPPIMRAAENEQDILVEVTLAYVSSPRRTRRTLKRYLSTWLDWKSSRFNEDPAIFAQRILKSGRAPAAGNRESLPWTLHAGDDWGMVQGARRSNGSLQKDWCTLPAHQLPEHFSIAVVGHQGWCSDPEDTAKYCLVVSFESVNGDLEVYTPIRLAVEALRAQVPAITTG